jgi:L-asparaginase
VGNDAVSSDRESVKRFAVGAHAIPGRNVYVERYADRTLPKLLRAGTHCNVHAGRQAGKTSLLRRAQVLLEAEGHLCLRGSLHVHARGARSLREVIERLVDKWYRMSPDGLVRDVDKSRSSESTEAEPLLDFITDLRVRTPEGKRAYLLLDEVDTLLGFRPHEVAGFLYSLRDFCQEESDSRVTLLFCSVRTLVDMVEGDEKGGVVPLFAQDVALPLFSNDARTRAQLIRQGFPDRDRAAVDAAVFAVLELTGGQPYLTCHLLGELQRSRTLKRDAGHLDQRYLDGGCGDLQSHFDSIRHQLRVAGDALWSMVTTYQRILKEGRLSRAEGGGSAVRLENIGLVRVKDNAYEVTCPIYSRHLNHQWIEEVAQDRERSAKPKSITTHRRSDKRVALLFTGGTAGMVTTEGQGSTFQGADNALLSFVDTELREVADVTPVKLFDPPLDGINVTPREWKEIADWIHKHLRSFDGFVVSHGTDTLAFTASALAFMFGAALPKPIVFTGAQTTIDLKHGDTRDNLTRACFVAAHDPQIREVQVLFGDLVLRAVRAEKADDRLFEGFRSPAWPPLALVTEHLLINDYALKGIPEAGHESFQYRPHFASSIVLVPIFPGSRPELYRKMISDALGRGEPIDGVILTTPGVGNIPSTEGYSFRPFIQDAVGAKIPVLITSQVPINPYTQAQYEMARVPEEYGAILTGNITTTAAVAKFSWVIGCVKAEGMSTSATYLEEIKARMKQNFVGEQADPPIGVDKAPRRWEGQDHEQRPIA